jgi:insulysin
MLAYEAGPQVVVMMRLFCGIVYDDLNSFSYAASVAGLSYSVDFSDSLSLSVSGFNDKLPELLQVVLARMDEIVAVAASAEDAPDDGDSGRAHELLQMLDIQRQLLLQDYSNFVVEEPWSVGGYYLSQLMLPGTWHLQDYIAILEQPPSLRALAEGVQKALAQVQIEILVHGNASAEEASFAADAIGGALGSMGASVLPELPRRKVTKLPAGVTTVFEFDLAAENPAQENCCTQAIYQVGACLEDYKRDACLSFACQVANTSAYQQLRTEEQLGYIVQAGWWSEAHVMGFSVLVQGTRLPPPEIDARIENWMSNFGHELAEMSDEDFSQIVQGMISERTQRCARLSQETSLHWAEIQPRRYQFDNLRRGVEALESLTRADVLEFFDQYLAASSSQRRKLSMRVLGTSAGASRSEPDADSGKVLSTLEDLRSFRESSEVFLAPAPQEMPTA